MGFISSPNAVLLVSIPSLFFLIFSIRALYNYFHRNNRPKKSVLPQVSYFKSDPRLKQSLYSCKDLDITNPRNSTASLILDDPRYAVGPSTCSLYSQDTYSDYSRSLSTLHLSESRASLSTPRPSILGDGSIFELGRNDSTTSLISTRPPSPASARAQTTYMEHSEPSLAALRRCIYGCSGPIFPQAQYSSQSLPISRRKSLSPVRASARRSIRELGECMSRPKSMYTIRDSSLAWSGQNRGRLPRDASLGNFDNLKMSERRPASVSPIPPSPRPTPFSDNPHYPVATAELVGTLSPSLPTEVSAGGVDGGPAYDPFVQWARQMSNNTPGGLGDPHKPITTSAGHTLSPITRNEMISRTTEHPESMSSAIRLVSANSPPDMPAYVHSGTVAAGEYSSSKSLEPARVSDKRKADLTAPPTVYSPRLGRRGVSQYFPKDTALKSPDIKRSKTLKLVRWSSCESFRTTNQREFHHFDSYIC